MKGLKLEFISQINCDGSGTTSVPETYIQTIEQDDFDLYCLSMSEKTFIAHGFNSYVVKLKDQKIWPFTRKK